MDIWRLFQGTLHIRITSADPNRFINEALSAGYDLYDLTHIDDVEITVWVERRNFGLLKRLADRRGADVQILERKGLFFCGMRALMRPAFLFTLALILVLAIFLPTRVYFVRVEGNSSLPDRLILASAEECGIRFGAKRSLVRSEKMKNRLLETLPQLQWAGINTKGCTAVISVSEKNKVLETNDGNYVSSIVACCDGVIEECTVIQGNALCKVGDAVKEGQVLVSGYTDCGLSILATKADAEILAKTIRTLDVYSLANAIKRTQLRDSSLRISVIIGKKQIIFSKDSGISCGSCVKMREELCITLPGGFRLPITVVKERTTCYDTAEKLEVDCHWADAFAKAYLQKEMIAGTILSENCTLTKNDDVFIHTGLYNCFEMIGIERPEEIVK